MDIIYHIIIFLGFFLFNFFGYYFSRLINKDFIQIFIGSLMISLSIFQLLVKTKYYFYEKISYNIIISLISFIIISFYNFLRQSMSILDDTLLIKCDVANANYSNSNDKPENIISETSNFSFFDNFITFLFYFFYLI